MKKGRRWTKGEMKEEKGKKKSSGKVNWSSDTTQLSEEK